MKDNQYFEQNDIIKKHDIIYHCRYTFQAFVYILRAHCQEERERESERLVDSVGS